MRSAEYFRTWRQTAAGQRYLLRQVEYRRGKRARERGSGSGMVVTAKLARGSCLDCGLVVTVENAVVFDFDHRDRSQKSSRASGLHSRPQAFRAEIEKCDLRCSNCHRLKTDREKDSWHLTRLEPMVEPIDVLF